MAGFGEGEKLNGEADQCVGLSCTSLVGNAWRERCGSEGVRRSQRR